MVRLSYDGRGAAAGAIGRGARSVKLPAFTILPRPGQRGHLQTALAPARPPTRNRAPARRHPRALGPARRPAAGHRASAAASRARRARARTTCMRPRQLEERLDGVGLARPLAFGGCPFRVVFFPFSLRHLGYKGLG